MTRTIRAHFDGRVIVPDEPVDIPVDVPMEVQVTVRGTEPVTSSEARRAIVDRLLSRAVSGIKLPSAALSREMIYGDD